MKKLLFLLLIPISIMSIAQKRQLIYCGTLIDGVSDKVRKEVTIIVENNKIMEVQNGYTNAAKGEVTFDLKSKTVMPGLMDMHVHIESESNPRTYLNRFTQNKADVAYDAAVYAQRTLKAGFTTVRDLGGSGVNIALRNAIMAGKAIGPRIYTSGKSIGTTGGHADPTNSYREDLMGDPGPKEGVINGTDEAMKAVRQRYKDGSDVIKITATGGVLSVAKDGSGPQFTSEEIAAIVRIANDYGMTTAAHAHGPEGMKRAVEAGITSIEHGTLMTPEIMELMKKKGTYYVPTITAGKTVEQRAKIDGYFPAVIVPKALAIGPKIQKTFQDAYNAGVKIAFGTDAGVFNHGENYREFEYMVEAGMKPMEAIKSATMEGAKLLRIDNELGSIEKGKLADIIAVDGDPLTDIKVMSKVTFVMKDGKVY